MQHLVTQVSKKVKHVCHGFTLSVSLCRMRYTQFSHVHTLKAKEDCAQAWMVVGPEVTAHAISYLL